MYFWESRHDTELCLVRKKEPCPPWASMMSCKRLKKNKRQPQKALLSRTRCSFSAETFFTQINSVQSFFSSARTTFCHFIKHLLILFKIIYCYCETHCFNRQTTVAFFFRSASFCARSWFVEQYPSRSLTIVLIPLRSFYSSKHL